MTGDVREYLIIGGWGGGGREESSRCTHHPWQKKRSLGRRREAFLPKQRPVLDMLFGL